jgi:hypothetical protein
MQLANELKECDIDFWQLNDAKKTQLILDSTTIGNTRKITSASAQRVELLTRRWNHTGHGWSLEGPAKRSCLCWPENPRWQPQLYIVLTKDPREKYRKCLLERSYTDEIQSVGQAQILFWSKFDNQCCSPS